MTDEPTRIEKLIRKFKQVVGMVARDTRDGGHADAEDAAQQALIATWLNLERVADGAETAYFRKTALRKASNDRRQRNAQKRGSGLHSELKDEMPDRSKSTQPDAALLRRESDDEVRAVFFAYFASLSEETRFVLILQSRGCSFAEIEDILGIKSGPARLRSSRAIRGLAIELKKRMSDEC